MSKEQKLFSDSETFTKERPKKITAEQEQEFCKETAEEIIQNKWSSSDIDDIIEDLKELNHYDNGYEHAKRLEDYKMKGSYNIDAMFVEFIDCFNSNKEDILRRNIKDWVNAHNITPKLLTGQKLLITEEIHRSLKKDSEIYITGMNKEQAYYTVSSDKNKNGGYIVDYEVIESKCTKIN